MKTRKILAIALAAVLAAFVLTACSPSSESASAPEPSTSPSESAHPSHDRNEPLPVVTTEAGLLQVRLGLVGANYEELWAPAKEALKKEGIDLQFVQFTDYNTPNEALINGEIDLNAFQHRVFFENDIAHNGHQLVNVGNTYIIPLNLYSEKVSSVNAIKDGAVVAIPNDTTNGGRALKVLEAAGLITLSDDARFNPTVDDIEKYNVDIEIQELPAEELVSVLPDVDAAIINGNYALDAGIRTSEAIFQDTVLEDEKYWNLLAARSADLQDPRRIALFDKVVQAFQSDATQNMFDTTYEGYFEPAGWDQDLLAIYK